MRAVSLRLVPCTLALVLIAGCRTQPAEMRATEYLLQAHERVTELEESSPDGLTIVAIGGLRRASQSVTYLDLVVSVPRGSRYSEALIPLMTLIRHMDGKIATISAPGSTDRFGLRYRRPLPSRRFHTVLPRYDSTSMGFGVGGANAREIVPIAVRMPFAVWTLYDQSVLRISFSDEVVGAAREIEDLILMPSADAPFASMAIRREDMEQVQADLFRAGRE